MIRGIGIDSVEIDRFKEWQSFTDKQLQKIFSDTEIAFCREIPAKSAERFAVRFAAREAFFKALSQMNLEHYVPFLTVCKLIKVERSPDGRCGLKVDWPSLFKTHVPSNMHLHISLTHDRERSVAFVVIEQE